MDLSLFVYLLAVLNPFVQVLYLWTLIEKMPVRRFVGVYARASVLTLGVFVTMAIVGGPLLQYIFQVHLDSLRIFGGLIMVIIGLRRVTEKVETDTDLVDNSDLPGVIALPYLIGPGTIWISILIGQRSAPWVMSAGIVAVMLINFLLVASFTVFIDHARTRRHRMLMQFVVLLMRTNALFIGAIGVDMIARGSLDLWNGQPA